MADYLSILKREAKLLADSIDGSVPYSRYHSRLTEASKRATKELVGKETRDLEHPIHWVLFDLEILETSVTHDDTCVVKKSDNYQGVDSELEKYSEYIEARLALIQIHGMED